MQTNNNIRILIADDHNIVRAGLIGMLETVPGFYIVGEADDGEKLISRYYETKPDLILTDISMPVKSGIEAVKQIRESGENIKVLFLSMFGGDDYVYEILMAGGNGLIQKNVVKGELIYAIQTVYGGGIYYGKEYTENKLNAILAMIEEKKKPSKANEIKLTERELEIIQLIYRGLRSREIAEKLCVSKRTIDSQRMELFRKLNVKSAPELIRYAITKELI